MDGSFAEMIEATRKEFVGQLPRSVALAFEKLSPQQELDVGMLMCVS
jgi:hypothetical protein